MKLIGVACNEHNRLSAECERLYGKGSAMRPSWWNGGNLETQKGRHWIISTIQEVKPDLVWISPECGPYSPMQKLHQSTPGQREALEEKRQHARLQYEETGFSGDLVYVWRIADGKKEGTRHVQKGQFLGPCRVLAKETQRDDDGTLRPGSVVWLSRWKVSGK